MKNNANLPMINIKTLVKKNSSDFKRQYLVCKFKYALRCAYDAKLAGREGREKKYTRIAVRVAAKINGLELPQNAFRAQSAVDACGEIYSEMNLLAERVET